MFLHLLISLQYLLLYLPNIQASQLENYFPCGQAKCYPHQTEVCVETIDEKDDKIEQFCHAGRFWTECAELGCKHNRCRTTIVTCEISNKCPRERLFKPKPPYKLHPESHELWAILAMFICIIPFLVFGGFIGVNVCGLHLHPKKNIKNKTDEIGMENEEWSETVDKVDNSPEESNHSVLEVASI